MTQKQREIIFYKQMLKDNNVEYESTHGEKNLNHLRDTIEEEHELEESSPFDREEAQVNAGFPGMKMHKKQAKGAPRDKAPGSGEELDVMVAPSFKELQVSVTRRRTRTRRSCGAKWASWSSRSRSNRAISSWKRKTCRTNC